MTAGISVRRPPARLDVSGGTAPFPGNGPTVGHRLGVHVERLAGQKLIDEKCLQVSVRVTWIVTAGEQHRGAVERRRDGPRRSN